MTPRAISRRSFLAFSATLPWAFSARAAKSIPVGLELYSVREELKKDPEDTVRAVAQMGYQGVEFYAPYFEWSESQTKQMRKLLDDLGIRCFSTHNDSSYLSPEKNRPGARLEPDSGQQVCGDGFVGSEAWRGRLEGHRGFAKRCRRSAGIGWFEGRLSQSPERICSGRKSASDRNSSEEYEAIDHAPTGCGHVPGGRLRSRGVDSSESGQNTLPSSQGLVTGTGERLQGAVWGRGCRVEKYFRSSGKWRRS